MSKILIVSPHADDETFGVGGTIARRDKEGHEVVVAIMTGHGEGEHPLWPRKNWDIVRNEAKKAHKVLGISKTLFFELPAVLVPEQPTYKKNQIILDVINEVGPDVLYLPFLFDLHKDHRELVYSCNVAWRPVSAAGKNIKEIYMYETISETHWNIQPQEAGFFPNTWVNIADFLERKIKALQCFESQIQKFPNTRSIEAVKALATWRGTTVGLPAAEAFILVRKLD